jgi:hypothetical protein
MTSTHQNPIHFGEAECETFVSESDMVVMKDDMTFFDIRFWR